jgi:hypothetical protein
MMEIKQSSGNMAFKIADYLGCDPIILIGQDLCFAEDGETTHVDGAQGGENQAMYHNSKMIELKGNTKDKVKTSVIWHEFLQSFEVDVSESSSKCINCSENGAYIKGTEYMPFEEVIQKYLQKDIYPKEMIQKALSTFSLKDIEESYSKVLDLIETSIPQIEDIISLCDQGLKCIENSQNDLLEFISSERLIEDEDRVKIDQVNSEVDRIKKDTQRSSTTFQMLMMHIVQSFFVSFEIQVSGIPTKYEDFHQAKAEMILIQKKWFAVIYDIAEIVLKLLKNTKDELSESRNRSSVTMDV